MEPNFVANVLNVARQYVPHVNEANFHELFKLTIEKVASHVEATDDRKIRNFLILLYWCRHYPPFKTLGALFGLGKSQVCDIIHDLVDLYGSKPGTFINLDYLDIIDGFPGVVGVVDGTEIVITKWVRASYSGKAHEYTVKYQVVVGGPDFGPVHIIGPFLGSISDATIWNDSDIKQFLLFNNLKVLGDKGYVGCDGVEAMRKKRKGQAHLDPEDDAYNRRVARIRVKVENHFADLKKWKVLSHVYRGDLSYHSKLFITCEFLTMLQKESVY